MRLNINYLLFDRSLVIFSQNILCCSVWNQNIHLFDSSLDNFYSKWRVPSRIHIDCWIRIFEWSEEIWNVPCKMKNIWLHSDNGSPCSGHNSPKNTATVQTAPITPHTANEAVHIEVEIIHKATVTWMHPFEPTYGTSPWKKGEAYILQKKKHTQ